LEKFFRLGVIFLPCLFVSLKIWEITLSAQLSSQ
jgi:hypothetical protein